MKKHFLFIGILFFSTFLANVNAQESKVSAGAGLNYATDINNIGISLQGLYKINPTWEVSPKFTYYFKKDYMSYSALDFNAHYVFSDNGSNAFYALAGLNITFYKFDFDNDTDWEYEGEWEYGMGDEYSDYIGISGIGNEDLKGNDIGLNIGIGSRFALSDKLDFNAEGKYILGNMNYLNLGIGILYKF